jgi:hypothetical protein
MSAFEWLWDDGPAKLHSARVAPSVQSDGQGATAPRLPSDVGSIFKNWISDMPALSLGAAFMTGVTLGWMIKRW